MIEHSNSNNVPIVSALEAVYRTEAGNNCVIQMYVCITLHKCSRFYREQHTCVELI